MKRPRRQQSNDADLIPVKVFCRLRPVEDPECAVCVDIVDQKSVKFTTDVDSTVVKEQYYNFEKVFTPETSQESIFEDCSHPIVTDVLNGRSSLMFCYGVTGSGKTYTQLGTPDNPGQIPRTIDVIFNSIQYKQTPKYIFTPNSRNCFDIQTKEEAMVEFQKRDILVPCSKTRHKNPWLSLSRVKDETIVDTLDVNYTVFVSYYEIYNDTVYDLLDDLVVDPQTGKKVPKTKNNFRQDRDKNTFVGDLVQVEVKSAEDCFEALWTGQQKRRTAHTALNASSSRSHSIFSMRIVQSPIDIQPEVLTESDIWSSQLCLVDLAGSERAKRTDNGSCRLREAGKINESLMVLRRCIHALKHNLDNQENVRPPYYDSKITLLFKTFFEGSGSVRMLVCVNPSIDDHKENQFVMGFAELAKEVKTQKPRANAAEVFEEQRQRRHYEEAMARQRALEADLQDNIIESNMNFTLPTGDELLNLKYLEDFHRASIEVDDEAVASDLQVRSKFLSIRERFIHRDRQMHEMKSRLNDLEIKKRRTDQEMSQCKDELSRATARYQTAKRNLDSTKRLVDALRASATANTDSQPSSDGPSTMPTPRQTAKCSATPLRKPRKSISHDNIAGISNSVKARIATFEKATPKGGMTRLGSDSDSFRTPLAASVRKPAHGSGTPAGGGLPVGNPKQRRSKSADKWLLQESTKIMRLDTIQQPTGVSAHSKPVGKIGIADFKKATKYALREHQQQEDGSFVDRFVKGDVVPTPSGGASVIMNDLETLVTSPFGGHDNSTAERGIHRSLSAARLAPAGSSTEGPLTSTPTEEHNGPRLSSPVDVKQRCSYGFEGHGDAEREFRGSNKAIAASPVSITSSLNMNEARLSGFSLSFTTLGGLIDDEDSRREIASKKPPHHPYGKRGRPSIH